MLQLMFRIAVAALFWNSGLTKIASWDTTVALFRDEYMVPPLPPEIAAVISATFELSCSPLIVVGLATRLATLPLLDMTFIIEAFVYPEYWAMHLMWASVLLFLLTKGSGVFFAGPLHCAYPPRKRDPRVNDEPFGRSGGLSRTCRHCFRAEAGLRVSEASK